MNAQISALKKVLASRACREVQVEANKLIQLLEHLVLPELPALQHRQEQMDTLLGQLQEKEEQNGKLAQELQKYKDEETFFMV